MQRRTQIVLRKGRDASLKRFHPWVFSGAIASVRGKIAEGDIVDVISSEGQFLGRGHWQEGSISVRILTFEDEAIDCNFWESRIARAFEARKRMPLLKDDSCPTNAYRLVHGEGDNLPGLIIDVYGNVAVIQAHSAGMFLQREEISAAIRKVLGNEIVAIYDKSEATAPFKAGLELRDGYLWRQEGLDDSQSRLVFENGHKFIVDWVRGQKTGFFLDQRDNRMLVGRYAQGRRVLNLFCYTGGFSIYALANGALSVDSVDSSATAIEMLENNVAANFNEQIASRHKSYTEDAIDFMKNSPDGKYDLIIVDPPAFAKHRGAIDNALRAYKRLNASAIEKVAKSGIVFTFSCSQAVDRQSFALAVFSAAAQAGRKVRIIGRLTQPADHPVNIYHPEGEYLKGLVLYVE